MTRPIDTASNLMDRMELTRARLSGGRARHAQPAPLQPPQEADGSERPAKALGGKARAHGVVRKLMDGHFNGVAAMRLRINFHDELVAAAGASVDSAGAKLTLSEMAAMAENGFTTLLEAGGLTDEQADVVGALREQLASVIAQARTDVTAGRQPSADLSSKVSEIFAQASAVLAPVEQEPAADVAPVVEEPEVGPIELDGEGEDAADPVADEPMVGDADEPSSLDASSVDASAVLRDLRSALLDALDRLQAAMTALSSLPPMPSAPANNGQAFQKFVSMYERMFGAATPQEAGHALDVNA